MKTFTDLKNTIIYNLKLTAGDSPIADFIVPTLNESIRTVQNIRGGKWNNLEKSFTFNTVANKATYNLPVEIRSVSAFSYSIGTMNYYPIMVYSEDDWNRISALTMPNSDIMLYYKITKGLVNNQITFYPAPVSSTPLCRISGRVNFKDLSADDYTAGTITATNNSATIVGTGTTFTAGMVGRYIKLPDDLWYQISGFTNSTTLTINREFEGTTTSGAAYKIGEIPQIAEAYQMAPVYRTMALYNQINNPANPNLALAWWKLYDGGYEAGHSDTVGGLLGQMIEAESEVLEGPYMQVIGQRNIDPNFPPRNIVGL